MHDAIPFERTATSPLTITPIQYVTVFTNPAMKSAIVSYTLQDDYPLTISIYSLPKDRLIKKQLLIPGNPGGRKGRNKFFWDGFNQLGVKVARGKYKMCVQSPAFSYTYTTTVKF